MDKIKIEFKASKNKVIEYNGKEIEINPMLNAATQAGLIMRYLDDMFFAEGDRLIKQPEYRFFDAELSQMIYILQSQTNIDIEAIDTSLCFDSELWRSIIKEVSNYKDFRDRLFLIADDMRAQLDRKLSAGAVIASFSDKISGVVDQLSSITPESITALQEAGKELIEKLEASQVVQDMERGKE